MFRRKKTPSSGQRLRNCSVPANVVVWAVGDIHGQDDLLECLLSVIKTDLQKPGAFKRKVIFLGDYVDRGLGCRKVIDTLISLRAELEAQGVELVTLRGNHEALLLQFIDEPQIGPDWMELGGRETLLSYDISVPANNDLEGWVEASTNLLKTLPLDHLEFFETLPMSETEGDYFFVHAGVRPGVKLEDQTAKDMMWIRDGFLRDSRSFDKIIVHGHTPTEDIYADDRRICLDTGGYATGVLSALRLQARTHLVVQTRRKRDRVTLQSRPLLAD